jgi:hypothetical protein
MMQDDGMPQLAPFRSRVLPPGSGMAVEGIAQAMCGNLADWRRRVIHFVGDSL